MHYDKIDPVEKVAMRLVFFKNITIPVRTSPSQRPFTLMR